MNDVMLSADNSGLREAEDRRARQLAGSRAIERLLKLPTLPAVSSWEIDGVSGTVRGQLALPPGSSSNTVIRAVRDVHHAFGGTARVRDRLDGGRELTARFQFALWDFELWQYLREPDAATLSRDLHQLRAQMVTFTRLVDPLGWIREDSITLRRHTARGWWELSTGQDSSGAWLLFGPDGSPYGEYMSPGDRALARDNADRYIAEHERP